MKALGILFTISAIVNLISAIAADDNDAAQESWISFATLILFAGFFYYRGYKQSKKTQNATQKSKVVNHSTQAKAYERSKFQTMQSPQPPNANSTTCSQRAKATETVDPIINENAGYPKLLGELTPSDIKRLNTEFKDEMISIMADDATQEQTLVKLELLLGKRCKTKEMVAITQMIRDFFRDLYDSVGQKSVNNSSGDPSLRKIATATALIEANQRISTGEETIERKQMREIANLYGVSINLINDEEYNRAFSVYCGGKQ